MARVQRRNSFSLGEHLESSSNIPGFYQGLAGIGYELLRLAHPMELPSVLLWRPVNSIIH